MTGNTFPAPNGVTASKSRIANGATTDNFTFLEAGRYAITWELEPEALDVGLTTLLLQQVVGTTTSTYMSMTKPGRYDIVLGTGGGTFNFTATVTDPFARTVLVRRASMTLVDPLQRS